MNVFEVKNGIYRVRQTPECKWETFFLIFDKRYPQDDGILINADEFDSFIQKKQSIFSDLKYFFGFPLHFYNADCPLKESRGRVLSVINTYFTDSEILYNNLMD